LDSRPLPPKSLWEVQCRGHGDRRTQDHQRAGRRHAPRAAMPLPPSQPQFHSRPLPRPPSTSIDIALTPASDGELRAPTVRWCSPGPALPPSSAARCLGDRASSSSPTPRPTNPDSPPLPDCWHPTIRRRDSGWSAAASSDRPRPRRRVSRRARRRRRFGIGRVVHLGEPVERAGAQHAAPPQAARHCIPPPGRQPPSRRRPSQRPAGHHWNGDHRADDQRVDNHPPDTTGRPAARPIRVHRPHYDVVV